MLRLLIFAPCEKAIVAEKGQSSTVGIIEMIRVTPKKEMPVDALIPFRWDLFILWNREQDVEQPVQYQAEVKIFRPDETETGVSVIADFEVSNEFKNFRTIAQFPVFPAGMEGIYVLKLYLKKVTDEEWIERGVFPVQVEHLPVEESNVEQANS
jgi:hypothetical protein